MRRGRKWLAATLVLVAGCGGEPRSDPAPPESSPAPVHSVQSSDRVPTVVLALEELRFPTGESLGADEAQLASRGPPAPRIEESALKLDQSTPRRLLQGTLAAIAARDLAALARLSRDRRRRPALDQDDAGDAERRFLASSTRPYWDRIARAIRSGAYDVVERGAEAIVRVDVGGAAGSYLIKLRREGDEWYLAG